MSKKKSSHIHKYMKVEWGKNKTLVWRCMIPGCPHYVHEEMARNRHSLCWECGGPFVMTLEKMLRRKPKCDNCQGNVPAETPRSAPKVKSIASKLDALLGDI